MINIKSASGCVRVNHKPADVNRDSKHWSFFVNCHRQVTNVPVLYIRRRMERITIPELTPNQLGV